MMKIKEVAFWKDRSTALSQITTNNQLTLFDMPLIVERTEQFMTCKIKAIPQKYVNGPWTMAVRKDFEFDELFNIAILKLRESGA